MKKYKVFEKVELWKESIIEVEDYYDSLDKVVRAYLDDDIQYIDSNYLYETEEILEPKNGATQEIWTYGHEDKPLWTNKPPVEGNLFDE